MKVNNVDRRPRAYELHQKFEACRPHRNENDFDYFQNCNYQHEDDNDNYRTTEFDVPLCIVSPETPLTFDEIFKFDSDRKKELRGICNICVEEFCEKFEKKRK